jgi:hypothetical protein
MQCDDPDCECETEEDDDELRVILSYVFLTGQFDRCKVTRFTV